ncbi:hypothetical protein NDI52_33310 [Leptolyngbya sp. PL-A3]|uniref:hypothetical protein n=1 Tax=Leptolyngbya sp. PL-A3 TaxID=2933911 RepID=UPI0032996EA7
MQKAPEKPISILATLDGLPPVEVWEQAKGDQFWELRGIREHFLELKLAFQAYFAGEENPVEDPKQKAFIAGELQHYLSFYNLCWFGWDAIKAESAKLNTESFPRSPGEALMMLLEFDCDAMCEPILAGHRRNVRESRAILTGGLPNLDNSNGLDKKRVARTLAYAAEVEIRGVGNGQFTEFCLEAVKKRTRGNPQLKRITKSFQVSQKRRFGAIAKLLTGVKGR